MPKVWRFSSFSRGHYDELNASFSLKHVEYGKIIFRQWILLSFLLMPLIELDLLKPKQNWMYVIHFCHTRSHLFVDLEFIN